MNFYKPMLAKPVSKPFSGKDWIFESKWDGFRAIAYIRDSFLLFKAAMIRNLSTFFLN